MLIVTLSLSFVIICKIKSPPRRVSWYDVNDLSMRLLYIRLDSKLNITNHLTANATIFFERFTSLSSKPIAVRFSAKSSFVIS